MRIRINTKRSVLMRVFYFCLLIQFSFVTQALAKPVWEFEVPIILKNMPEEVKYVAIGWAAVAVLGYGEPGVIWGRKELHLIADANGNFSTVVKVVIHDTDIKDFTKVHDFAAYLELSEDGFLFCVPNTAALPWSKAKPGTKLVKDVSSELLML